ncbi:hypothetical protein QYE76_059956 [Lolium multiflorum]|uniref:Reverse transcriptase zinc-binding domain-containing protein n=1 Tax=Lolium multiflorum TaxID=4521 RepID=A0AAD8W3C8_LOLMU|nr:hypothetical protein QYE76_059956 [Lolium multiflorum]
MCPLCGGADETIDHIMLHCGFACGIWSGLVARLHLPDITATGALAIWDWWPQASRKFGVRERTEVNSLIMLVMRSLWLERNARVFDGKRATVLTVMNLIADEWATCFGGGFFGARNAFNSVAATALVVAYLAESPDEEEAAEYSHAEETAEAEETAHAEENHHAEENYHRAEENHHAEETAQAAEAAENELEVACLASNLETQCSPSAIEQWF